MEGLSRNIAAMLATRCAALLTWAWHAQTSMLVNLIHQALHPLWDGWSFDVFSTWQLKAYITDKESLWKLWAFIIVI